MTALKDLTGQRFGKLFVLQRDLSKKGDAHWECRCDCGNETIVRSLRLSNGRTRSCGCLVATHRMSYTREYATWQAMISRCYNQNASSYKNYGARGITVCERWRESFPNFFADLGPRPSSDHSIERIETNGNYEPSNVKWILKEEQVNNRRNTQFVMYRGEKIALTNAIKAAGSVVSKSGAEYRINRKGWPVEKAIETPGRGVLP